MVENPYPNTWCGSSTQSAFTSFTHLERPINCKVVDIFPTYDLWMIFNGPKAHFTNKTKSPWPLHYKHSHWWKRRSQSKFASHYTWGTNKAYVYIQDGCKVYMVSYMASNGSCSIVTWIIYDNPLLEVGPTQNRETMAPRALTTIDLFYFIMCEDPHEHKFIEIAFNWGPGHTWLHTMLEGPWQHYMILEVCWDSLGTLHFGLSQFHGHGAWLVFEVTLRFTMVTALGRCALITYCVHFIKYTFIKCVICMVPIQMFCPNKVLRRTTLQWNVQRPKPLGLQPLWSLSLSD